MATFPLSFPIAFGGTATAYGNAGVIVNDAALELGLAPVADPFNSNDGNFMQLVGLLKSLGRKIWRMRTWTSLTKEYVFTTTSATTYPFPADFGQLINQTAWDRTNQLPAGGPLSPQEWQEMKARQVNLAYQISIRQLQNDLQIFPNTAQVGRLVAYEYLSRYWVASPAAQAAGTGPDQDSALTQYDAIWFDPLLMVKGLRLEFRKAKGLDTSSEQPDYEEALALCMGDDSAMPTLSVDGGGCGPDRLLTTSNFPDTGYGS